jgi:hypothetical protein
MIKKIISVLLVVTVIIVVAASCVKSSINHGDPTLSYFPVKIGHYVVYDVDSSYYTMAVDTPVVGALDTQCMVYDIRSQMKYAITDTTRDANDSLIYIVNVFYRHYDGDKWQQQGAVMYIRANNDSIQVNQDGNMYTKMKFPVKNGYSWNGNFLVDKLNPADAYLQNWNYVYSKAGYSYNNLLHNFENTVSVVEDDESVNYPFVDSALQAYRTYAKEVYAYNVGMVYKEWTHWVYYPNATRCVSGYTVVMRAVEYN